MNSTNLRSVLSALDLLPLTYGHSFVPETDFCCCSTDRITEFSQEEDEDYSSFGTLIDISKFNK